MLNFIFGQSSTRTMLIRKNTKAFKTILQLVKDCKDRADREKLIRLYITKAGQSIDERISVEGLQGEAELFYDMGYETVLNNLESSNHQLNSSDEVPGIYYFHSSSNKIWDEAPFEFDEAIKKEFSSLPELPVVRKKEKAKKYDFPAPKSKEKPAVTKKEKARAPTKEIKIVEKAPRQPDFKLRHKIQFTDLDKIIFRQPRLNKQDVLSYYSKISEYILPYMKDRPLWVRQQAESLRAPVALNVASLFQTDEEEMPDWVKPITALKDKTQSILLCNDKEHILLCVERGYIEFNVAHAKVKQPDTPDYILIVIDSPEFELVKALDVTLTAKEILDGLKLPSFIKADGKSGLHVYIPLDSKSKFETTKAVAEYICRLISLKIPNDVVREGSGGDVYGKVSLDYTYNEEGKSIVAPYSLVAGPLATIATPLLWEEIKEGLRLEDFNTETIFTRLKNVGDPFETFFRKKVNADELLERLEDNYSFLF